MPIDLLMSFISSLECGPLIACVSNHSRGRPTSLFAKGRLDKRHPVNHAPPPLLQMGWQTKVVLETSHLLHELWLAIESRLVCLFVLLFLNLSYPQLCADDAAWLLSRVRWMAQDSPLLCCYHSRGEENQMKQSTQDFSLESILIK